MNPIGNAGEQGCLAKLVIPADVVCVLRENWGAVFLVIAVIVIVIATVLGIAVLVVSLYKFLDTPVEPEPASLVEPKLTVDSKKAAIVLHLAGRKFICCETGTVWNNKINFMMTEHLASEKESELVECYDRCGLVGVVGRHSVRFATEGNQSHKHAQEIPIQAVWILLNRIHDKNGFDSMLKLLTYPTDSSPAEGAAEFVSGSVAFDGFFMTRHAAPWAIERIEAAKSHLDEVVGGFATRWGAQISYASVIGYIEIGFPSTVLLDIEDPVSRLDGLLADACRLAETMELALDPGFIGTAPQWVDCPVLIGIEMLHTCPECNTGVPINGPINEMMCPHCQSMLTISEHDWDFLANGLRGNILGGTGTQHAGSLSCPTKIEWSISAPICARCSGELPVEKISPGTSGVISCPRCGAESSTFPPPQWLSRIAPWLEQVYGAEGLSSQSAGKLELTVDHQEAGPIGMTCPGCGGMLSIKAPLERTVQCGFCSMDIFLPDQLWKKLHPSKTSRRWWIRFGPIV